MNEELAFLSPFMNELAAANPTKKAEPQKPKTDKEKLWSDISPLLSWNESRDNPKAVGKSNDIGLFQITPIAIEELNRVKNLKNGIKKGDKGFVNYFNHSEMFDPVKNTEAAREMFFNNFDNFVKLRGTTPERDDMIMMHNRPTFWNDEKSTQQAKKYLNQFNLAVATRPIKLRPIGKQKEEKK